MARRIHLAAHLSGEELRRRYRTAQDPVERSRWQMLWLLEQGQTAQQVGAVTGYSAYWVGQIAQRYNTKGLGAVADGRHRPGADEADAPAAAEEQAEPGAHGVLSTAQQAELCQALAGPEPHGGLWNGRTVSEWISARLGRRVSRQCGWSYLRRLGWRPYRPRPRHVRSADAAAQETFKGGSAS